MAETGTNQKTPESQLSPKQRKALEALLVAPTLTAAAEQAGCTERSIRNWLQDGGFKATFLASRRAIMDAAILDLQKAYSQAAKVLISLLDDENPHVQLRAADLIMSRADKWIETEDLEARISALERQAFNNKYPYHRG
jgi:hypothetical protein